MDWNEWVSEVTQSCHHLFYHFQFALLHGPDIPGSYTILLFIASDLASITSHIHNWVLFLLWLHPFILFGVISPLITSSILGTYRPGKFIFRCPIFLPFHAVHGFLKVRILKWFASLVSSGPHSLRPFHHDPPILGGPTQHGLVSLRETRLWSMWSDWLVVCDCGFRLSALWCPLSAPIVLLGFCWPWMWGIPSWLPLLTLDVGYIFLTARPSRAVQPPLTVPALCSL